MKILQCPAATWLRAESARPRRPSSLPGTRAWQIAPLGRHMISPTQAAVDNSPAAGAPAGAWSRGVRTDLEERGDGSETCANTAANEPAWSRT